MQYEHILLTCLLIATERKGYNWSGPSPESVLISITIPELKNSSSKLSGIYFQPVLQVIIKPHKEV